MPRKRIDAEDSDLLVKTATTVDLLHTRLFGGDGQTGALPYLLEQQKELTHKLDNNKQELLNKIEEKKDQLIEKMDVLKKATDDDIRELRSDTRLLERKVNWFAGGIATIGSIATLAMGWFAGFHNKG